MTKETRPNQLENTQNHIERLGGVLVQREALPTKIRLGNGPYNLGGPDLTPEGAGIDEDIKIGEKRERTINRVENHISTVLRPRLSALRQEEINQLVSLATDYKDDVAFKTVQLKQMRNFVKEGVLPEELLSRREAEFEDLQSLSKKDENIRRGLELLAQLEKKATEGKNKVKQSPQPETVTAKTNQEPGNKQKKAYHTPGSDEVLIDFKSVVIPGPSSRYLLEYLIENSHRYVLASEIRRHLHSKGFHSIRTASNALYRLRNVLRESGNSALIEKFMGSTQAYRINPSWVINEQELPPEVRKDIELSIDVENKLLKRGEEIIPFSNSAHWLVLNVLAEKSYQGVPSKDLTKKLADAGFISENALHSALFALRKLFGESAEVPRLIQMVKNKNTRENSYLLQAAVSFIENTDDTKDLKKDTRLTHVPEDTNTQDDDHLVFASSFEAPTTPKTETSELIEIPYSPSEEEVRSDEETAVLRAFSKLFRGHSWVYPNLITDEVNKELRRKQGTGFNKRYYPTADSLFDQVKSSLTKMEVESRSPLLIEHWSEEDFFLWEDLQGTNAVQRIISRLPQDHPASIKWIELRGEEIPEEDRKSGLLIVKGFQTHEEFLHNVEKNLKRAYANQRNIKQL